MIRTLVPGGAAFATMLAASQPVPAQPSGLPPVAWDVAGLAAVTLDTDLDAGGSFSSSRWFLQGGVTRLFSPRQFVGVSAGIGQSFFEFSRDGLTDEDLTFNEFSLALPFRVPVSDTGTIFVVPSLQYAAEAGVGFEDGTTYGLLGGIAWRVSPNLSLGPGLGVFSTHGDDVDAFPILLIDWQISERWALSTGGGIAATRGPGLTLSYQASDNWNFGIAARYESFEFRLDDEGDFPNAVGTDRSVPVVLTAAYEVGPFTRFAAFAGARLGGSMEFETEDGETIAEDDYDPAPILGLLFETRF